MKFNSFQIFKHNNKGNEGNFKLVFSNEGTDILFIKFSIFGNGLIKNDIPLYNKKGKKG